MVADHYLYGRTDNNMIPFGTDFERSAAIHRAIREDARAKREDRKLDTALNEDPVIRNARSILVSESKSAADKQAIVRAFQDPAKAAPDMKQRINDALQRSQTEKNRADAARYQKQSELNAAMKSANVDTKIAVLSAKVDTLTTTQNASLGKINDRTFEALARQVVDSCNQLDVLYGLNDNTKSGISTTISRKTPERVVVEAGYVGEWAVSYVGDGVIHPDGVHHEKDTVLNTSLQVTPGYIAFGKFRNLLPSNAGQNIIAAPSALGDYVIFARQYASNSAEAEVGALPAVYDYEPLLQCSGYDGIFGMKAIARATVANSADGTKYWTNLVQCQYGEIFIDRYDPEFTGGYSDGGGAAIEGVLPSDTTVTLKPLTILRPLVGGGTAVERMPDSAITISSTTFIFLKRDLGTNTYTYETASSDNLGRSPAFTFKLLWVVDTSPVLKVVAHMSYGAVQL